MKRSLFAELKEGLEEIKAAREGKVNLRTFTVTKNNHIGSSFDDFLRENGRLDEATEVAKKRIDQFRK